MRHPRRAWIGLALVVAMAGAAQEGARQDEIARRGAQVMPFALGATRHVYTKTADGGIQQVVVRRAGDEQQTELIRTHLHALQERFTRRDFSLPERIHGPDMPGLAQLRQASAQQLAIAYRDIEGGALLRYTTPDARIRAALHAWFDAQLADHGRDATPGQEGMHHHAMPDRSQP